MNIKINQNIPGETSYLDLVEIAKFAMQVPRNGIIVEVGSFFGRASWVLARNSHETVDVFCIDTWDETSWVKEFIANHQLNLKFGVSSFRQFMTECENVIPIRAKSPYDLKKWFLPINLVFEDSVHDNPNFKDNLEFWSNMLVPGGIIFGRDYASWAPDIIMEVRKLASYWNAQVITCGDHIWGIEKPV